MRLSWLAGVVALAVAACAGPAADPTSAEAEELGPPAQADLVADGRTIAEADCAACHAVGEIGDSPNPQAPPFRTILSNYRADVLEEELIAGIQVAHPMPDFQFNPQGADALVAYLQSIQEGSADNTL